MRFSVEKLTVLHQEFGDDPAQFCVQLHCEVTSSSTKGGEAFSVTAISPARLQADLESSPDGVEIGRGHVLMLDYNETILRSRLQTLLEAARASSWTDLQQYISRFFDWV